MSLLMIQVQWKNGIAASHPIDHRVDRENFGGLELYLRDVKKNHPTASAIVVSWFPEEEK